MAEEFDHVDRIMMATKDPTVILEGHPIPASTTLLYRVCKNDGDKLEEAHRLVRLFIEKALEVGPDQKPRDA